MNKKIFILILSIWTFMFSKNVLAKEHLIMDYQTTPYYYRVWSDKIDSGKLTLYNLNGDIAYCIEPGIHITDDTYIETSIDTLGLDANILNKIKLIGYYGYEYPNHLTSNYRMATQALIWETLQNVSVSYWTGRNQTGDYINVDNEKNEIMKLVNNHYIVPNIPTDLILSFNRDNVLIDTNQVLENFEIINNNSNLDVYKEGNNLHIKSDEIGDYTITLRKIKYDNKTTILYTGSDGISQKLMKLRFDDNVETKINIHITGGKILLKKLNSETNDNTNIGFSNLQNAIYGIYDENNILIEELSTNELGEVNSSYLKFGKYYLKEINPSYGYLIDSNNYEFTIDENNLNQEIEVLENLIKKELIIVKTLEGDYSLLDKEPDITFNVFLKDTNILYDTITTDKNGVAKIYLPYGEYLFQQVNTNEGYLKSDDFVVLINEDTEDLVKVIYDKRVRGNLKIIKIDDETNDRLKNALIEVYKDDDLIFQGLTDELGTIELNDLYVGKYKIKEIKAPDGYVLNNQEHLLYITNDIPNIELEIKNKPEEVIVPNTELNTNNKIKYYGFAFILMGLILIVLSRRKKV